MANLRVCLFVYMSMLLIELTLIELHCPFQTAHVVLLEPMSECLIVGAIASWGVSVLFHWDSLAFYLIHILCWFLSDWMLLTIVQVRV